MFFFSRRQISHPTQPRQVPSLIRRRSDVQRYSQSPRSWRPTSVSPNQRLPLHIQPPFCPGLVLYTLSHPLPSLIVVIATRVNKSLPLDTLIRPRQPRPALPTRMHDLQRSGHDHRPRPNRSRARNPTRPLRFRAQLPLDDGHPSRQPSLLRLGTRFLFSFRTHLPPLMPVSGFRFFFSATLVPRLPPSLYRSTPPVLREKKTKKNAKR